MNERKKSSTMIIASLRL